jgi:Transposase DDE domain
MWDRDYRLSRGAGVPASDLSGVGTQSKNGMGWWYGFKLHVQCDEAGCLCGFDLTTATVDDRKLLNPLTRWMTDGIVVGDGGYLSRAKATELAQRGVYLLTATRKNMRKVASQFQLACLQLRHRVEELFAFMKCAFGAGHTTHRAAQALPIHSLSCLLAYSLIQILDCLISFTGNRVKRVHLGCSQVRRRAKRGNESNE